jgi:hypothetical protein
VGLPLSDFRLDGPQPPALDVAVGLALIDGDHAALIVDVRDGRKEVNLSDGVGKCLEVPGVQVPPEPHVAYMSDHDAIVVDGLRPDPAAVWCEEFDRLSFRVAVESLVEILAGARISWIRVGEEPALPKKSVLRLISYRFNNLKLSILFSIPNFWAKPP